MRKMQTVRVTTVVSFVVFSILTTFQVEAVEKDPALRGKWLLLQIDRGGKDIDLDLSPTDYAKQRAAYREERKQQRARQSDDQAS